MKLHTIEHLEAKVKNGELELDKNQKEKVMKKKDTINLIKAVEYSLKIATGKRAGSKQAAGKPAGKQAASKQTAGKQAAR